MVLLLKLRQSAAFRQWTNRELPRCSTDQACAPQVEEVNHGTMLNPPVLVLPVDGWACWLRKTETVASRRVAVGHREEPAAAMATAAGDAPAASPKKLCASVPCAWWPQLCSKQPSAA
eukprot:363878-Chlamydomonas_euryale.AAC.5